jgi:hypothetical protein
MVPSGRFRDAVVEIQRTIVSGLGDATRSRQSSAAHYYQNKVVVATTMLDPFFKLFDWRAVRPVPAEALAAAREFILTKAVLLAKGTQCLW